MRLLAILFTLFVIPMAFAQTDEMTETADDAVETTNDTPETADASSETAPEFAMYIPPKMIAGESYEGTLLLSVPSKEDLAISFATDDRSIIIPPNAVIPAGENQMIFPINPGKHVDETITIHAITTDGRTTLAKSDVHSISSEYTSLHIVTPGKDDSLDISSKLVPLHIFLTDTHQIPIISDRDIPLKLSSTSTSVEFSNGGVFSDVADLHIPEGEYFVAVTAQINGDGRIYATSDGLEPDSVQVNHSPPGIQVRLGVAPTSALADSAIYYYVWIEQGGAVYKHDELLDVYMSSDPDHVRFDLQDDEEHHLYLKDGVARGILYTRDPGEEIIVQASIPGFGGASAEIDIVGELGGDQGQTISVGNVTISVTSGRSEIRDLRNTVLAWVFPDTPSDKAWAVAGIFIDPSLEEDEPLLEGVEEEFLPLPIGSETMTFASLEGLQHETAVTARETRDEIPQARTSAYELPIDVETFSDHMITASTEGTVPAEVSFATRPLAGLENRVEITAIPTHLGRGGPIAYASIVDGSGTITDAAGITSNNAQIIQVGKSLEDLSIPWNWVGGSVVIEGKHVDYDARVHVLLPGVESEPMDLHVAGIQTAIELWFPPFVNRDIPFPVVIHAVDDSGVPVRLIRDESEFLLPSAGHVIIEPSDTLRFIAENDGRTEINIISNDRFIASRAFTAFSNDITEEYVSVRSKSPDVLRLGSEIVLDLFTDALGDAEIDIAGLDFVQDAEGAYVTKPKNEGNYDVTVTITKEGWRTYERNFEYSVERLIDVTLDVLADDGVSIPATIDAVHIESDKRTIFKNGLSHTLQYGLYQLNVEQEHEISSDRIYSLKEVRINGKSIPYAESFTLDLQQDTIISLLYHREISVSYVGLADLDNYDDSIQGNGKYRYGDRVTLVAPSHQELFGLIWHVPSKWIDLPDDARYSGDTATFEAIDSVSGYVEYEKNYFVMIVLISSATIIPFLLIRKLSPDALMNLGDSFQGLAEKLRGAKLKPKMPRVKK